MRVSEGPAVEVGARPPTGDPALYLLQVAALKDGLHWGHRVCQLLHMDAIPQDGAHL